MKVPLAPAQHKLLMMLTIAVVLGSRSRIDHAAHAPPKSVSQSSMLSSIACFVLPQSKNPCVSLKETKPPTNTEHVPELAVFLAGEHLLVGP